jgi:hypothetical protein
MRDARLICFDHLRIFGGGGVGLTPSTFCKAVLNTEQFLSNPLDVVNQLSNPFWRQFDLGHDQ